MVYFCLLKRLGVGCEKGGGSWFGVEVLSTCIMLFKIGLFSDFLG